MKRIILFFCCFYLLPNINVRAQIVRNTNEINVEAKMQTLVTEPNGDYEIYKSQNGNIVMARVEKGNIKSVYVMGRKNVVIPSTMGRGSGKAKCFIEWEEGSGRKIRIQIKCPTRQ